MGDMVTSRGQDQSTAGPSSDTAVPSRPQTHCLRSTCKGGKTSFSKIFLSNYSFYYL